MYVHKSIFHHNKIACKFKRKPLTVINKKKHKVGYANMQAVASAACRYTFKKRIGKMDGRNGFRYHV